LSPGGRFPSKGWPTTALGYASAVTDARGLGLDLWADKKTNSKFKSMLDFLIYLFTYLLIYLLNSENDSQTKDK